MNFKLKRIVEILSVEEKRELSRKPSRPVPKPRAKPPVPLCPGHPDKPLEFYCKQCRVLICSQCVLHSHRFHKDPVPADEALKDKMASLVTLHGNAEGLLTQAGGTLDNMAAELKEVWLSVDKDVANVQEYFAKLKHLLSQQEMEVCKSIESRANKQQKMVDKQKQVVISSVEEVCKYQGQIHTFIESRSSDIMLLSEEGKVVKKLEAGMNHLAHIIETSKDKPHTTYHTPFAPSPQFESLIGTVGMKTESPLASNIRHSTMANTPSGRRRPLLPQVAEAETTRSADSSPVIHREATMGHKKPSPHGSPVNRPAGPSPKRDDTGVLILTPSLVIGSTSVLGPTLAQKTSSAYPCGVCVGDSNTLVVADAKNHMISILTPTGKFLHSVVVEGKGDGQMLEPTAVICASGNILVADRGHPPRVQVLTDSGLPMTH